MQTYDGTMWISRHKDQRSKFESKILAERNNIKGVAVTENVSIYFQHCSTIKRGFIHP